MIRELIKKEIPNADDMLAQKLAKYYEMLVEWNGRMNLTAITDPEEVVKKHFADSLLPMELIPEGARCIDVGTGAGFPGIPLLIARGDISVVLLDSLQKRLSFLEAVTGELELSDRCRLVHARAEDAARMAEHRERYDIALSRAVANTAVLLEYTVPFLKTGGTSLMYKGASAREELGVCGGAIDKLKVEIAVKDYEASWGERCVTAAKKLFPTAAAYPRKPAEIKKKPL